MQVGGGEDYEGDVALMDRARREQEEEWREFQRLQSQNDQKLYRQLQSDDEDGHLFGRILDNRDAHERLMNNIRGRDRERFDLLRVVGLFPPPPLRFCTPRTSTEL